jgi:hypothetical protein
MTITYQNVGAAIPHLILRVDSFGTFTVSGVSANVTLRGVETTLTPRRLRTIVYPDSYTQHDYHVREQPNYVYVYEIGHIPAGAHVAIQARAHLTQKPCCRATFLVDAFGRFNAQGLLDLRSGIENGGTFSSGTV